VLALYGCYRAGIRSEANYLKERLLCGETYINRATDSTGLRVGTQLLREAACRRAREGSGQGMKLMLSHSLCCPGKGNSTQWSEGEGQ
jgi:hypothetical protein